MAMEVLPDAIASAPIAIDKEVDAWLLNPMETEKFPDALEPYPIAVEYSPEASVTTPMAARIFSGGGCIDTVAYRVIANSPIG